MLPWLFRIILVTWCIHHALSRPARRTVRLLRRTSPAPMSTGDLDQTVEGSSFVEDYVPHQGNSLGEFRRIVPRRRYPTLYDGGFGGNYPTRKDWENLEGVVTLGESRSYSILKQTRPDVQTDARPTQIDTTRQPEIATEAATTDSVTTTPMEDVTMTAQTFNQAHEGATAIEPASLLTEDRPYVTAVQRSHFSVDEAVHAPVSAYSTLGNRATVPYPLPPTATTSAPFPSTFGQWSSSTPKYLPEVSADNSSPPYVVLENSSPNSAHETSPVSYRTSLKTATSGSSVSFYRHLPNALSSTEVPPTSERLNTETRVEAVSYREEVAKPLRPTEKIDSPTVVNEEKSYQFTNVHDKSYHHVQVTHLEPSDKRKVFAQSSTQRSSPLVYGLPEENYEVDEALSLKSNGRAHGVQPNAASDSNKFGYVVEGRNYKKYRVEERTNDGFIVGEYGVVRHDDGSLRGVRYTADSTINPRVIYEALVKFLSL